LSSEAAVRFGLDNVVRTNDSCAFVCAYRKAANYTSDPGPFMDGAGMVSGPLPFVAREKKPRRCHVLY
jgi:hypothetical protein